MSEIFKDMKDALLRTIDEQLCAQIDSMFELEYEELAKFGLTDKPCEILDLCCGNAYYLIQLAKKLPSANFTGVDFNVGLCAAAEKNIKNANMRNIRIIHKSLFDYEPDREYNAVITRAAVQYFFSQVDDYLRKVNQCLKDGGILILVEPDDYFFMFHPEHQIFDKLRDTMNTITARHGGDRYVGRKLPKAMIKAGFKDIKFVPKIMNNYDIGDRGMFETLRRFPIIVSLMDKELFSDEDARLAISTLDKICDNSGSLITLPIVMVKGTKDSKS
ncbi:class I SAM-dependent methyltransferase [Elusimicrobiota bacterium]